MTISARHLREVFELQVVILLAEGHDELKVAVQDTSAPLDAHELGVARWVLTNDQVAGAGTNTLPGASALYLPLKGGGKTVGVVGVHSSDRLRLEAPEDFHLLEIFINQTAVALERTMRSGIERAS